MKNPISFLTFSSLSLTVCLLSQYLTSFSVQTFMEDIFGNEGGGVAKAIFFGFCQLAQLFYGIFAGAVKNSSKTASLYFFGFSQLLYISVFSLLFDMRSFFLAIFWTPVLFFVTVIFTLSHDVSHAKTRLLVIPQLLVTFFLLALCLPMVL